MMECRMTIGELRCREVINICDGCRLGFVGDIEFDLSGGCVCALLVPRRRSLKSLLEREENWVIPWNAIRSIGDDIILVEDAECRSERRKVGKK